MQINKERTKICQIAVMSVLAVIYVLMILQQIKKGLGTFDNGLSLALQITDLLAIVSAILYLAKGYSKSGAVYYKLFLIFFLLLSALTLIKPILHGQTVILIPHAASLLILLVLTFWKDLGEKNSWILFWILAALQLAIAVPAFFSGNISRILDMISHLLLVGTYGFMLMGKYEDKKERGRTA